MIVDLKQVGWRQRLGVRVSRWTPAFGVVLVLAGAALTAPAQGQPRAALRGHIPSGAVGLPAVDRLPSSNRMRLAISLPLRDEAGLDRFLTDLYDPANPAYRQYLTPEQFTARFCLSEVEYEAVADYAATNGLAVTYRHPNRLVLDLEGSVADIERTFQTTLRVFHHPTEARTFYAPDTEPSVGPGLPIASVSGLDNFALPHPHLRPRGLDQVRGLTPDTGSGPSGDYVGKDFRVAYVPGTTLTGTGQSVGLLEFDGFYQSDITAYESLAGLPSVSVVPVSVDGGGTITTNNVEVALDIDMVISMAPGVSKIYVYEAPNSTSEFPSVLSRMASDNLAKQLSCSWAGGGVSSASETVFKQMASQGQSFFCSSGDSDAYVGTIPFPDDSTNITIVGGTTLTTTGPQGAYVSEKVWNWGGGSGSSGGVSTYYGIPSYQQGLSMASNLGSTTRRNLPDVALTADNIFVYWNNGSSWNGGGTSASAPLWAGFCALINQQAVANGRATVGFLNPALYALGKTTNYVSSFHDITTGDNTWSGSSSRYYAVPGYDLATGWGTPTGTNLIFALAGTPGPTPLSNSFALVVESCTNGFIDPGETVTVNLGLKNVGGFDTTNLVATLQTGGGVLPLSGPQTYGVLTAGGAGVALPFTFMATGTCGSSNTATLQLQDGTANYLPASFTFQLGKSSSLAVSYQSFDTIVAPALPSGWTTSSTNGESNWITSTNARDTGANSAFSPDPTTIGLNELDSPAITLPNAFEQLSFRQNYDLETGYDGGVLEIKIGSSGSWTDILTAGGSFVSGGYVTALDNTTGNPLGGRLAWTGTTGGFITTVVNLPPAASGQQIRLRWRCGTDTGTGGAGWFVDTVRVTSFTFSCCVSGPVITLQPQSQTNRPGSTVSFLASASGTSPLAYQWQFGGTNIPGATATSYSKTNLQYADAGAYTLVVTNSVGSATSSAAVLTVVGLPFVVVPPANQTVECTSNASFTVTASGQSLAYQWYFGRNPMPGQTNSALNIFRAGFAQAGDYSVVITNVYGLATGGPALLAVVDTIPPTILSYPSNATVALSANCQAVVPDLTSQVVAVDASGPVMVLQYPAAGTVVGFGPMTISLMVFDSSFNMSDCAASVLVADLTPPAVLYCVTNVSLAAATNCDYPLPDLTGTNYFLAMGSCSPVTVTQAPPAGTPLAFGTNWVVLSAVNGSGIATNRALPVLVPMGPVITSQPTDIGSPAGSTVAFSLGACGFGPLAFAWQHGGTNLAGATNSMLTLTHISSADAGGYQVWVTNSAAAATSRVATLTLLAPPPPVILSLIPNLGPTNGGTPVTVLGSGFQNGAVVSFGGLLSTSVVFVATTNLTAIAPPLPPGAVDVAVTNADGQSGALTNAFTYGVPPGIQIQPTNLVVNSGSAAVFYLTATGSGPLSYQWSCNATNLVDTAFIMGSQSNVLDLASVTAGEGGTYQAVVSSPFGTALSVPALLTVSLPPPPFMFQSISQSGAALTLVWNAIPGRTYQLQSLTPLGQTNWANVGSTVVATNSIGTGSDTLGPDQQRFYRVMLLP